MADLSFVPLVDDLEIKADPKSAKGTVQTERRQKSIDKSAYEKKVMEQAKRRDHRKCRFPRCDCGAKKLAIAACHEKHRGMGGNPKRDRTTLDQLITLCVVKHGAWDRGEIAIVPQDRAKGFNGPADFYAVLNGQLFMIGAEKWIGESVTRDGR
jgi:hypothetical protein